MKKRTNTILIVIVLILGVIAIGWYGITCGNKGCGKYTIKLNECHNEIRCNQWETSDYLCNGTLKSFGETKCKGKVCSVPASICVGISKSIQYQECKEIPKCEQKEVNAIEYNIEKPCMAKDCAYVNISCELTDETINKLNEETKIKWQESGDLVGNRIKLERYEDLLFMAFDNLCKQGTEYYDLDCTNLCGYENITTQAKDITEKWLDEHCSDCSGGACGELNIFCKLNSYKDMIREKCKCGTNGEYIVEKL